MTKGRTIRLEHLLLVGLGFVLFLTRFLNLNARPLTDYEAVHALDATWNLNSGANIGSSDQSIAPQSPLYHFITHLLFQYIGDSDSIARVTPAIGGMLLLFSIWAVWRDEKTGLRLIWLFILGFSPVMVTISRNAGGDMLSAAAILAMLLFLLPENQPKRSTIRWFLPILFGLSLTTGPGIFRAFSGILLTVLIAMIVQRDRFGDWIKKIFAQGLLKFSWLVPVTAIVILSGFGSSVAGFRGFATTLELWLRGWAQPSGYSFLELIVLLITTEPLIFFFGILGIFWFWRDQEGSGWMTAIWTLGSGIFLLLYRGRSPFDLLWIVLPLSYLAALTISSMLDSIRSVSSRQEMLGLVAILAIFLASGVLSVVAYGTGTVVTINPANPNLLVYLFLALAIMGVSVLVFFGIGWSWSIVAHALGVFVLVIGFFQGIASTWKLNFSQDGYQVANLWWQIAPTEGLPIAVKTLEHTALAVSGHREELLIEIRSELPDSLTWAFRNFQKADDTTTFGLEASPVIIVREEEVQTDFSADYIGQSLGLRNQRAWETLLPPEFFRWLITGAAPHQTERWVIWVRVDIASFGEFGLEG